MWTRKISTDVREIPSLRRDAITYLRSAGLAEDDIDVAALVLTELVSNAIRHAAEPAVASLLVDDGLRVQVTDASRSIPRLVEPDPSRVGGHGIRVIDALAARWGVLPHPTGKTVWCELPT